MNQLTIFGAEYLIFIANVYAIFHVLTKHERKHHVRHIAIIFGSALLAWVVTHFLKDIVHHPRPDLTNSLVPVNDPYSFPSGHTTYMFSLAFAMLSFDKKPAYFLFVLAAITGICRVLVGVHYWYDIVGGIVVAYGVVAVVLYLAKRYIKKA